MRQAPIRIALLAFALSAALATGQPAHLPSVNPLDPGFPTIELRLSLPRDTQPPEQKIVPRLWSRLARSGEGDEVPVIIELYQPLRGFVLAPYSEAWDREQADLSAAIEQRFASKAGGLVSRLRGLSHFPIVLGTATKGDLLRIAGLPEVSRLYEDEVVSVHRAEGAALMAANTLRASFGATGKEVGVAVLDTGIDDGHFELASRIVVEGDYTGTTGNGTIDDNGHGTSVAGIIAGSGGGLAPQANLWAIKVMKASGNSTFSSILDGLTAIYAARNQFGGLDIVNMSLGSAGPFNGDCDSISPLNQVLNSLYDAGVAIFASSGNDGFASGVGHPACHSKVIAVGAVYDANLGPKAYFVASGTCTDAATAADKIPCYSNSGVPLDLLAPADCARTTARGGGYNLCFTGTSAAAPYAAGVAAQLLSLRPGTSPASLKAALESTGRPRTDVNGITRGRIDAVAALQALGGGSSGPCVPDSETACLLNGRFEATVSWNSTSTNGAGHIMSFGGQRAENDESAFFWFFHATNFELGLKILDACGLNGKFWVFLSGLTDQGWTVRIRDTATGATKTYANPIGRLTPTTADTSALSCP
jgi:subtilisin family serine protease